MLCGINVVCGGGHIHHFGGKNLYIYDVVVFDSVCSIVPLQLSSGGGKGTGTVGASVEIGPQGRVGGGIERNRFILQTHLQATAAANTSFVVTGIVQPAMFPNTLGTHHGAAAEADSEGSTYREGGGTVDGGDDRSGSKGARATVHKYRHTHAQSVGSINGDSRTAVGGTCCREVIRRTQAELNKHPCGIPIVGKATAP